jgi:uncharacterized protein
VTRAGLTRGLTATQATVLGTPAALIAFMYLAFQSFTNMFGFPLGYLVAFGTYWLGWCIAVPFAVLGRRRVVRMFTGGPSLKAMDATTHAFLWWPIVFPLAFSFVPRVAMLTLPILLVSVCLGIVTGVTEELLWRGMYVTVFPGNIWLNTAFPSIAFGVWHLCPLASLPSRYPGGTASFVTYSMALGLSYAFYARRTQSVRWCAVSHSVHDALGLGALIYSGWLT